MTVIDFQATINARRADAKKAGVAAAKEAARQERRQQGYDALGAATPAAKALVDAICDLEEHAEEKAAASRHVPAYCDPSNEVRGSKYDATKGLTRVEIAARIRADIKEASKAKRLPAGLKVSVRARSYSGGGAIDVRITALPAGLKVWNPDYVAWRQANPHDSFPPFHACDMRTVEYHALVDALKAIHGAYNRDNSDGMSDYFDCRYYGDVELACELDSAIRRSEGL